MSARRADSVTDRLFPGPNDLVVDTESMHSAANVVDALSFDKSEGVHHCAYFTQQKTLQKLGRWLMV